MRRVLILFVALVVTRSSIYGQCTATPVIQGSASAVTATGSVCTALGKSLAPGGSFDTVVVWRSTDGAHTWIRHSTGVSMLPSEAYESPIYLPQEDSSTVSIVGWSGVDEGKILTSFDAGNSWQIETPPVPSKLLHMSTAPSSEAMILGEAPVRVFLRGDVGWRLVDFSPLTGQPKAWALGYTYGDGKYRAFCTRGTQRTSEDLELIYTTHDSWNTVDSSVIPFSLSPQTPNYDVDCYFGHQDMVIALASTFSDKGVDSVIVCRSSNGGESWSTFRLRGNAAPAPVRFITRTTSDTILAMDATSRHLLDYSTDAGLTWHVDTVLTTWGNGPVSVTSAARLPDGSFAAAFSTLTPPYNYLGRLTLPTISRVHEIADRVMGLSVIVGSKPNLLRLIGAEGDVRVYDILGRLRNVEAVGEELDVSNLRSGAYLLVDSKGRSARFIR